MNKNNIIYYLYKRGLIAQITHAKLLIEISQTQSINVYCGFDPTADSLHIGHLVPLLCLRRFQKFGHRPVILLGGATGLIGDPSFKNKERNLNLIDTVEIWIKKLKKQVSLFVDCSSEHTNKACIVDNYHWFSSMNTLIFLRNIGKYFSINKMINRDSIKNRLKKNNHGLSYTEFSYNLLQSYDFAYLYKHYGTILQIGGSDQWGNIVSGIDLIHRMYKQNTYGLTVPLITQSNNIKFGKTEKDTIWLDAQKTSPYKFYQYWINSPDNEVYKFLKFFTDIDINKINSLKKENDTCNIALNAKKILAEKMTKLVHGKKGLEIAQHVTENLFTECVSKLTLKDFTQLIQGGVSTIILDTNTHITLQQVLVETKLASSRSQARKLISSNAITMNTTKQLKTEHILCSNDKLYNRYTLIKRGKKNFCLIQWK